MPVQIVNVGTPTTGPVNTQQCQEVRVTVNEQWDAPNPRLRFTSGQACDVAPAPDTVTGATLVGNCYVEDVPGAGFTLAWNTGTNAVSFEASDGATFFVEDDITAPAFADYWWDVFTQAAPGTESSRVKGFADDPFVEATINTGQLSNAVPDQGEVTATGATQIDLTWQRETPGQDKSDVTVTVDAPATVTEIDPATGEWEVCRDSAVNGNFAHTLTATNDLDASQATAPADFEFTGGGGGGQGGPAANAACEPAAAITDDSATISGTADDVDTDQQLVMAISTTPGGPYANFTGGTDGDNTVGQQHSENLGGLTPETTYYYVLRVRNADNSTAIESVECSFTTLAEGAVGPIPTIAPPPFVDTPEPPMADVPTGYSQFVDWVAPGDSHWRNGVTTEPWSCPLDVHEITDVDCAANNADRRQKDLGPRGVPVVSGSPFVLHSDYNCGSVGRTFEEAKARAAHRLSISENLGLSRRVLDILQTSGAADLTPTPGTAVSLAGGIGMLQQWLADNIGAHGMIHAPIILGPYLQAGRQIIGMGDVQVDTMGNRWAFGAAHGSADSAGPGGLAQPDGTAWLYATGQFRGHRGETFFTPPDVEGGGINRANNDMVVIAEREYVLWHECDVAAILVNVSCCC